MVVPAHPDPLHYSARLNSLNQFFRLLPVSIHTARPTPSPLPLIQWPAPCRPFPDPPSSVPLSWRRRGGYIKRTVLTKLIIMSVRPSVSHRLITWAYKAVFIAAKRRRCDLPVGWRPVVRHIHSRCLSTCYIHSHWRRTASDVLLSRRFTLKSWLTALMESGNVIVQFRFFSQFPYWV